MRPLVLFGPLALVVASACPAPPTESDVNLAINEVMPRNTTSITDAAGENDDWIEIANLDDTEVALDGFTLGDSANAGAFPAGTVIAADGYLVVFADDTVGGTPAEPHFPFKLSGSGDSVELKDAAGLVVDGFDVPALEPDISFGRVPDGIGAPREITAPTPREANE